MIELTDKKIFEDLYELGTRGDSMTVVLLVLGILLIFFISFILFYIKINKSKNSKVIERLNDKMVKIIMEVICGFGILITILSIGMGFSDKEKLPNQNWYVKREIVIELKHNHAGRYSSEKYSVRYGDNNFLEIDEDTYNMILATQNYGGKSNYTDIYIVFDEKGKPLLCYPISNYKYVGKNLR